MLKAIWKAIVGWLGFLDEDQKSAVKRPDRLAEPPPSAPPRPPAAPTPVAPPERKLYEGKAFEIGAADMDAADAILHRGGRSGPTPAQRRVLFSEAAATTVLAGAGSGKSTTLVQRVLFMHKMLKIDFSSMAVFTFTRKSRHDFIRKLLEEAPAWGVALNDKQAQRLVRTFHSKALGFAKDVLGKDEQIFEFVGAGKPRLAGAVAPGQAAPDPDELNGAEQLANDADGFIELDGSDEQAEILKDTYVACYHSSERFRSAILRLYCYTLASRAYSDEGKKFERLLDKLRWMSSYDEALCQHTEDTWRKTGQWPLAGVVERIPGDRRFELAVMGEKFVANGYVERLGIHVVLGQCDGIEQPSAQLVRQKVKQPLAAIVNKRRALLVGSDAQVRYIQSANDLRKLQLQLAVLDSGQGLSAPAVMLRLPNESEKPAFQALYAFGAFVETIGLQPDQLARILAGRSWSPVEQAVIDAASEFFAEFYVQLHKRNLVSFNQVFSKLGERSADLQKLSISSLIGVKHLMIDEFQDISPLIVNFVRGVQGQLLRKSNGSLRPTLMCVGDDWQSIYGWRGSSPHFLLQLPHYFPGASPQPIQMQENFRSSQKVIDCGEAFIAKVQVKSAKRGVASHPAVKDLPYLVGAVEKYSAEDVTSAVTGILDRAGTEENVYILAATHHDLAPFRAIKDERLLCTTFHQSKGLEADYVVLVGAPRHFGSNELKNALYKAANFPHRYDDAQRDEAFRVAYVAATRARKFCLWFAEASAGSVIEAVPADGIHRLRLENRDTLDYVNQCVEAR